MVTGDFEVDGSAYFDAGVTVVGTSSIDGNTSIAAGNSFTCDNVTTRIAQGVTGLTTGDSPTFASASIGYIVVNGTADHILNLEDATANTAEIKLTNNATIKNTTASTLELTHDNIHLTANGGIVLSEANNNAITMPHYIQNAITVNGALTCTELFSGPYMALTGTADSVVDLTGATANEADIKLGSGQRILNVHSTTRAAARSNAGNGAPVGSIVIGCDARASTKPDVYIKVASNNNDNDWERVVTQAAD